VYNRSRLLVRCVQSVLAQSLPPTEILVVDDGSTDAVGGAMEAFGARVRLLRLGENRGVSAARNFGVDQACGRWIAFLDSDDTWHPDKLAMQWDFLRSNPHYELIQSEEIWIRNGVRVNRRNHHAKPHGWILEPSLERCLVSPSCASIRQQAFVEIGGFDEALPVCEDYDLWIRWARWRPVGLDRACTLVKYGGHADQLSQREPAMDRFRVQALLTAWRSEREPMYSGLLAAALRRKLQILIAGARKRGRECAPYERFLSEIDSGRQVCA